MNQLTLFHATTDFYLPMIKKTGLGGLNPNKEYGILDFLKSLSSLCEQYLRTNKTYQEIKFTNDQMIAQSNVGAISFRHDKTCLAYNIGTAIRYANNKYCSELLTRIMLLHTLLTEENLASTIDYSALKINFDIIKTHPHRKIILRVDDIKLEEVETEAGGDSKEEIEKFLQIKESDEETFKVLSQQLNFNLIRTIPINRIKIAEITDLKVDYDTSKSRVDLDYKLVPYK